ncbi:peptide deformylase [Candidatus Saccharibacteria bacterium]|nr:peptide deformylase [Candidatus Saccharibacteria bacterium]
MTKITQLGDPILRKPTHQLSRKEITSLKVRATIAKMKEVVEREEHGVGISANQIGENMSISVIAIKPTPARPNCTRFEQVLINPEIIKTFGWKVGVFEGCLSCGGGKNTLFGRVLRYKKVRVKYLDEITVQREIILDGLAAHIVQHEIDHLNGIVFLDIAQHKTLMTMAEYNVRIVGTKQGNYYEKGVK